MVVKNWWRPGSGTGAKMRKWARGRIIVNPSFQFRTLLPVGLYTLLFAVLAGGFAFLPLYRELSAEPDPGIQVLLREQLLDLHVRLWPMLGLAALLTCLYVLLRSHRVAGPLFRLSQVLTRMTEGEYTNVRFRKGDEFREFASITNQLGKKMQALSTRHRDVLLSVESRVKQLALRLNNEDLPKTEVQNALDAILAQLSKARERVPTTH